MKSLFSRLKKRKGFTLVECIVAIAVFAAFCLMVVLITAGAQREAKMANDTEAELNGLIDNISSDDVYRGYNSDHYSAEKLDFNFSGSSNGTFSISYDIVDGHKNYIACSGCKYYGNNTEFMNGASSQNFNPAASIYVCPECSNAVSVDLKCANCGETGHYSDCDFKHNSANKWTYSKGSGTFVCNKCGSGNVSMDGIEKYAGLNALSVSGIAPNAIRYGTVVPPDRNEAVSISGLGAGESVSVTVKYGEGVAADLLKNPKYIADYTVTLSVPVGGEKVIGIQLPKSYLVSDFSSPEGVDATFDDVDNKITVKSSGSSGIKLKFKLINKESGFSFDYDYQKSKYTYQIMNDAGTYEETEFKGPGLAVYWFGLSGNGGSGNWPIPETESES